MSEFEDDDAETTKLLAIMKKLRDPVGGPVGEAVAEEGGIAMHPDCGGARTKR